MPARIRPWEQGLPPDQECRQKKTMDGHKSVNLYKRFPSDPRSADRQLDEELRKAQRKSELQMNEAAEQHDENNALKAECASLRSSVKSLRI